MNTTKMKKAENDRRPVVSTTYGITRMRGMSWNDMRRALSVGFGKRFSATRRFA